MNPSATTQTKMSAPVAATPDNGPDCERVNTVLDQLIEGQPVTAEDEDYLYDHATDCSPCFDDIEKQRTFISFLKQRVPSPATPSTLHESILARVGAVVA
ncbi:hypothetical protein MUN81_04730 [Hymenobacter sp. 5317J-9]|uniref:hypothetical protein n=1 Tax=Hymenobacter sp. 5317J-9 TaxID=2932250 RepID=UPI001FD6D6AF|nr:hypothetical protein [Hymenobacter sp. 5317J-9]UOQ98798.1 hypothetical protein MUN81_04730 [Hymenobacter sp. 5317J-9]